MKKFKQIIGIVLIFVLALQIPVLNVKAQDGTTEAEKECEDLKPDFEEIYTEWTEIEGKERNADLFEENFEKAKSAYHEYAQCMFDSAEQVLLKSKAGEPDFPWNDPGKACLTDDERNKLIESSDFGSIAAILQKVHREYDAHLTKLLNSYKKVGRERNERGNLLSPLNALLVRGLISSEFEILTKLEIENALVAMDMTFITLRELRLALIMHIHFECMMKNLEKFRSYLESLRIIIDLLPDRLEDASMSQ